MVHKCLETTPEVGITQLYNLGHTKLKHVLTSSDIDKILSGGFVNFDVTISYMMFVPFKSQISMLGIVKKHNSFTISPTLATKAKSNTTPEKNVKFVIVRVLLEWHASKSNLFLRCKIASPFLLL